MKRAAVTAVHVCVLNYLTHNYVSAKDNVGNKHNYFNLKAVYL